jgi:hypothetical protein
MIDVEVETGFKQAMGDRVDNNCREQPPVGSATRPTPQNQTAAHMREPDEPQSSTRTVRGGPRASRAPAARCCAGGRRPRRAACAGSRSSAGPTSGGMTLSLAPQRSARARRWGAKQPVPWHPQLQRRACSSGASLRACLCPHAVLPRKAVIPLSQLQCMLRFLMSRKAA